MALGDREQLGGAAAGGPERRALSGAAPRQEQGAGGVLAEAGGEERGLAERLRHLGLDLLGRGEEERAVGRLIEVGQAEDHPVVAPEHVGLGAARAVQAGPHRGGPGRVDARAEGGHHADPHVAELVEEVLDHDPAIAGHLAGGGLLFADVREQVVGGARVEAVLAQARLGLRVAGRRELARELADAGAELLAAPRAVAAPEGHLAGHAGRGRDDDALVGDLLHAPGRRAEHEDLAGARLVDHLLVELADPAALAVVREQEHAVEAAIGDGPGVGDGELARAVPRR